LGWFEEEVDAPSAVILNGFRLPSPPHDSLRDCAGMTMVGGLVVECFWVVRHGDGYAACFIF